MMGGEQMYLAGDIGATKTVLALLTATAGVRQPVATHTYLSADFPSLEAILGVFLSGRSSLVQRATFGVAGPVIDRRVQITNRLWGVDARSVQEHLGGAPVHLLNDLEALGHGVPHLIASDLATLNVGNTRAQAAIGIVAPGTGMGEGFLVWDGSAYRPCVSEGGHCDFAPNNEVELALLGYLMAKFGHVSIERVCSGLGLPNIYAFLRDTGREHAPEWLEAELEQVADATPIIVVAAQDAQRACAIATRTLDIFVDVLAAEAGSFAVRLLALGGVFLGGGIPPRILARLQQPRFMATFLAKGRLQPVLRDVPVHVILNSGAGLLGASQHVLSDTALYT